jgi:pre-mRNA-splicing factor SYF1
MAEGFGVTSTREVYEKAISALADSEAKNICMDYAEMERKLGEIDRARAIYAYAGQFCDPNVHHEFWKKWHDFEISHGNEDTFREMLRIKRTVQANFNLQVNNVMINMVKATDAMKQLEMEQE